MAHAARVALPVVAALAVGLAPGRAAALAVLHPDDVVDLSGSWLFREGDNASFRRANLDDLSWKERRVPTATTPDGERWQDHGWYRLHVTVSEQAAATDLMLAVGTAREAVEVYVNGSLIATRGEFGSRLRGGGYLRPLAGIVPEAVLVPGNNVIAVRVYDPSWQGGLVGGPFLLGNPESVRSAVAARTRWVLAVRVGLALLALFVSAAYFGTQTERRSAAAWWILGAGASLCLAHLAGTGALAGALWIDLSPRLPMLATLAGILCVGSAMAQQYEDLGSRRIRVAQGVLLALLWAMMLIPARWFFFVGGPLTLLCALVTTLYAANLCARAVRRGEPGSLPTFVALCALAAAVVYDGFSVAPDDLLPPASVMGAALFLGLQTAVQTRQIVSERADALQRMVRLRQRLEGTPYMSLLEAATLPRTDGLAFLSTVVHEIARDLQVRRCSLVLRHTDGSLRIRASVGLPQHLASSIIDPDSITAYAFMNDRVITQDRLPDELREARRGRHVTEVFITQPVRHDGRVLGVLNLSDRNDGGVFAAGDEQAIQEVATGLGTAIAVLPPAVLEPPPEVAPELGKRPQTMRGEDVEAAFDLVASPHTAPAAEVDERSFATRPATAPSPPPEKATPRGAPATVRVDVDKLLADAAAVATAPARPAPPSPSDGAEPDPGLVGSSRVDLQACKLEYSIVSPK